MDRFVASALYLFALGVFAAPALANVGLVLLVLVAAARLRHTLLVLTGHPAWPALLALTLFLATQAAALAFSTGLSQADVAVLADLAKLTLLVPLGLAVAGQATRAGRALALAGLSLLLCMALHARPGAVWQALSDGYTRLGFGLPAIAFGLYAATALLGVFLLAPTCAARFPASQRRALLVVAGAALALIGAGVLVCRSRGAWLALGLTLPPCAAWVWHRGVLPRPALAGLGAVLVAGLLLDGEALARRLTDDGGTYRALAGLSDGPAAGARSVLAALPADSVGLRLRLSGLALEHWRERPWFGHGPDGGRQVIAQADNPELSAMAHLHNTYLELLVRFGVVGLAGFGAALAGLGFGLHRAVRAGALPPQLAVFLVGALAITLVWSAFDFRLLTQDFRFHTVLLAGIAFGLGLPRREAPCAS